MKTTLNLMRILSLVCILLSSIKSFSQTWQQLNTNSTEDFKTVFFIDANTGWVGGNNGTIIKTTDGGTNWSLPEITGTTNAIRSLYFIDSQTGWAGGDAGTVRKTTNGGATWDSTIITGTIQNINCIKFTDSQHGWFVGGGCIIKKTTNGGNTWVASSPTHIPSGNIWGFCIVDPLHFWASATGHFYSKTIDSGASWDTSSTMPGATFQDIQFTDIFTGWIVGTNGIIRHTTDSGATWIPQTSPTSNELLSIDMRNPNLGWSCGRVGTIIHYTNGTGWNSQVSGSTHHLWQVSFVNDTTGWIAGDGGTVLKYQLTNSSVPLQLTQPNGGEIYQIGTIQPVSWLSNGVANIKIEYSTNGANGPYNSIVNSTPANIGSYAWNINALVTPSLNAFIRIEDLSNPLNADTSDNLFYIQPVPQGIDYAVLVTATSNSAPPQITLNWNANPNTLTNNLDRKLKSDNNWTFLSTLPANINTYTDYAVNVGDAWEYRITETTPQLTAYGYIYAGLELVETDFRGKILLLIDQNFATTISAEVDQLELDLIGDGYRVKKLIADPAIGVAAIKNLILQEYNIDTNITSVLTIGHLPAPYSGNFAPDGHSERVGAQPADGYYGDIDFIWTDSTVTTSNSGPIYTPNVPGDGKFDPSTFPSDIELSVGRIDMNDMTGFSLSESGLLQQYLNKNHSFRLKNINPGYRAIMNTMMDTQFPNVSTGAWRSNYPMFGNQIKQMNCNMGCTDFIDSLDTESYLWAHMAGGGSDTSMASDVFTSGQCISNPINAVFMQMYGSYFVEWYKGGVSTLHNHLLRAPLASNGTTLATVWSGKAPFWHFHHMALGETIGYSTITNQNNLTTYDAGNATLSKGVHMNLMGDPTLKMHIVAPVSNLNILSGGVTVDLNWTASTDIVVGYNIYRADSITGTFTKLNSNHVTSTNYNDPTPLPGNSVYMVRAVKLEVRSSGSYYNLSTGMIDSAFTTLSVDETLINQFTIYPNPTSDILNFSQALEKVDVYNAYGQVVISNILNSTFISVENLASGIYFIKSGNTTKKFIVKH